MFINSPGNTTFQIISHDGQVMDIASEDGRHVTQHLDENGQPVISVNLAFTEEGKCWALALIIMNSLFVIL